MITESTQPCPTKLLPLKPKDPILPWHRRFRKNQFDLMSQKFDPASAQADSFISANPDYFGYPLNWADWYSHSHVYRHIPDNNLLNNPQMNSLAYESARKHIIFPIKECCLAHL